MAAIILPHRMRQQPQNNAVLDLGNPLLRGVTDVFVPHLQRGLVTGVQSTVVSAGTGTAKILAGSSGMSLTTSTGTQCGQQVGTGTKLFPSSECTIFIFRRSKSTTGAQIQNFGYSASVSNRVLISAPWNDGNCYWDYGNTTTTAGGGRGSAAFVKVLTPETLVFVAGTSRGREIWRNGVNLVANTAVNLAPTITATTTSIGGTGISESSDSEEVYLVGVVARTWSPAEIREWARNPWGIFRQQERLWANPSSSTKALTGVSATGDKGTLAATHTKALTGLAGVGAKGTLGVTHAPALTEVAGSGTLGSVGMGARLKALTGVSGTGARGVLTPTQALTGRSATGAVGSVGNAPRLLALTEVAGVGAKGTLGVTHAAALSEVAGVGAARTMAVVRGQALTGAAGIGAPGSVGCTHSKAMTGVAGAGVIGSVSVTHLIGLAGNQGGTHVGNVSPPGGVDLLGVSGAGVVGSITISRTIALTGAAAATTTGLIKANRSKAISGLSAASTIGILAAGRALALHGSPAAGAAGSLTMTQGLAGVAATSHIGSLKAAYALPVVGVTAVATIGSLRVAPPPTLNPVFLRAQTREFFLASRAAGSAVLVSRSPVLVTLVAKPANAFIVNSAVSVHMHPTPEQVLV